VPRAVAVVALVAAVPPVAGADGLVVSALLAGLLGVLVVVEQLRGAHRGEGPGSPRPA
jgi:hypothetical protein